MFTCPNSTTISIEINALAVKVLSWDGITSHGDGKAFCDTEA
jgi:hypothetical protein